MNGSGRMGFIKGACALAMASLLATAIPQTPPFNPVGTWDAKVVVNEKGLAKRDPETQKMLRTELERMARNTWQAVIKEDKTYVFPGKNPEDPSIEEGTWKTGRGTLTLTTLKRKGEVLKKKLSQTFKVSADGNLFSLAASDFATVEYTRRKE